MKQNILQGNAVIRTTTLPLTTPRLITLRFNSLQTSKNLHTYLPILFQFTLLVDYALGLHDFPLLSSSIILEKKHFSHRTIRLAQRKEAAGLDAQFEH